MEANNRSFSSIILVLGIFNRKRFGLLFLAYLVAMGKKDSTPDLLWAISLTSPHSRGVHGSVYVNSLLGLGKPSRAL